MYIGLLVAIICGICLYLMYKYPCVQVVGDSMEPTYYNGQYLMAVRVSKSRELHKGKVYVFKTLMGEIAIKRLDHSSSLGLFFIGDNIRCSFDSRSYGYVPRENVIAEIINP